MSTRAKTKYCNLKLCDKISNFEEKKINHVESNVHKPFGGFIFGCKVWKFKAQLFIFYSTHLSPLLCHLTPLFSNSVTLPFVNILDVSLQTKPCSGTPCLCQNLYHQITFLSVGKYRHRSNNFSASYTRTKEPPHVTSPYSSCTSSQKLYQIQFVTPPLL